MSTPGPRTPVSVLLVDDHALLRAGVRSEIAPDVASMSGAWKLHVHCQDAQLGVPLPPATRLQVPPVKLGGVVKPCG